MENIKELRKQKKITQVELSKLSNISIKDIQAIEKGESYSEENKDKLLQLLLGQKQEQEEEQEEEYCTKDASFAAYAEMYNHIVIDMRTIGTFESAFGQKKDIVTFVFKETQELRELRNTYFERKDLQISNFINSQKRIRKKINHYLRTKEYNANVV